MKNRQILPFCMIAASVGVTALAPVQGVCGRVMVRTAEQDAAYRGVSSGQMLSLDQIRAIVARKVKGEYMGVEIDDGALQEGAYVYRLTYRRPNGAIVRVDVDARSGRILGIHGS